MMRSQVELKVGLLGYVTGKQLLNIIEDTRGKLIV